MGKLDNKLRRLVFLIGKINWWQTLRINFKAFGFSDALKFPIVVFYGFKIKKFSGEIKLNIPIKFGILSFGHPYEIFSRSNKSGEASILGTMEINGSTQFGVDTKLYINKGGHLTLGHINSFGSESQIICFNKIHFGNWVQCGSYCMFVDTNFHPLKNVATHQSITMSGSIEIGSFNYIGIRTTIRMGTKTAKHTLIASNSLLNKDYTSLGEQNLLGGIPAIKLKEGIIRDWETEMTDLENYLKL